MIFERVLTSRTKPCESCGKMMDSKHKQFCSKRSVTCPRCGAGPMTAIELVYHTEQHKAASPKNPDHDVLVRQARDLARAQQEAIEQEEARLRLENEALLAAAEQEENEREKELRKQQDELMKREQERIKKEQEEERLEKEREERLKKEREEKLKKEEEEREKERAAEYARKIELEQKEAERLKAESVREELRRQESEKERLRKQQEEAESLRIKEEQDRLNQQKEDEQRRKAEEERVKQRKNEEEEEPVQIKWFVCPTCFENMDSRLAEEHKAKSCALVKQRGVIGMEVCDSLIVVTCRPGGAAHTAGIQLGDVVTSVRGQSVKNLNEFDAVVANKESQLYVGDVLGLTLVRHGTQGSGKDKELSFQLRVQPPDQSSRKLKSLLAGNKFSAEEARSILRDKHRFDSVVQQCFDICDVDRSGHLDREEVKVLIYRVCLSTKARAPLKEEIDVLFDNMDLDGSGLVSLDEFRVMIKKLLEDQAGRGAFDTPNAGTENSRRRVSMKQLSRPNLSALKVNTSEHSTPSEQPASPTAGDNEGTRRRISMRQNRPNLSEVKTQDAQPASPIAGDNEGTRRRISMRQTRSNLSEVKTQDAQPASPTAGDNEGTRRRISMRQNRVTLSEQTK